MEIKFHIRALTEFMMPGPVAARQYPSIVLQGAEFPPNSTRSA
jgi:hypothetical protein